MNEPGANGSPRLWPNPWKGNDMTDGICSVDGCERPVSARGWCGMHYMRWWKTGDVRNAESDRHFAALTFERLVAMETDDHLLWPHSKTRSGYGRIKMAGSVVLVHQAALARRTPRPGPDFEACHEPGIGCVRLCMNYRHLRWDTHRGNMADMRIERVS